MGGAPSTQTVGPGLGAFVAFFFLALALWLLMRNMNGRMRRMAYRERDRLTQAQAAAEQTAGGDPRPGSTGSGPAPGAARNTDATPPPLVEGTSDR